MIEAAGAHYKRWKKAKRPEWKQELWFRYVGRYKEMMAALQMIWAHPQATDEIKKGLWDKVYALSRILEAGKA